MKEKNLMSASSSLQFLRRSKQKRYIENISQKPEAFQIKDMAVQI